MITIGPTRPDPTRPGIVLIWSKTLHISLLLTMQVQWSIVGSLCLNQLTISQLKLFWAWHSSAPACFLYLILRDFLIYPVFPYYYIYSSSFLIFPVFIIFIISPIFPIIHIFPKFPLHFLYCQYFLFYICSLFFPLIHFTPFPLFYLNSLYSLYSLYVEYSPIFLFSLSLNIFS